MSDIQQSRWLVTTEWLASRLGAPDVVVVDGSYYLPAHKRDASSDYITGHIPGAVHSDYDKGGWRVTRIPVTGWLNDMRCAWR